MKQADKTLWITVLVTSLSFLGMAFPYPIIAPLFFGKSAYFNSSEMFLAPSIMYGLSLAAYPFAQFFGSIWLGKVSDRFGRKPTLQLSILFTSIGFLFSAKTLYDHNLIIFIISRLISGFFEGHIAIARAIASDLGSEIDKSKSFALLNAAATSGYIIGPVIGGIFADDTIFSFSTPSIPFVLAAILCAISLVIVSIYIEEPNKHPQNISNDFRLGSLINSSYLLYLVMASFFVTISFDILYQFFPVMLVKKWGFNEFNIALTSTLLSLFMVLSQILLVPMTRNLNRQNVIFVSTIVYAATMAIAVLPKSTYSILVIFPILGLCIGIAGTYVPVYVSDQVPNNRQGQLMGILMGSRSLGDAGICLLGSITLNLSYYIPFFLASMTMLLGCVALLFNVKTKSHQTTVSQ